MKPSFISLVTYFIIKYVIFYLILMIKQGDFYLVNPGINNIYDIVYYVLMLSLMPLLGLLVFLVPMYYALKSNNKYFIVFFSFVFLALEYFMYSYLASPLDSLNGLINEAVSIIVFFVLFREWLQKMIGRVSHP